MTRRTRGLSAADLEVWRVVAETVPHRMPGARLPPRPEIPRPETRKGGAIGKPEPPAARGTSAPGWSPPPQRVPAPAAGTVDRALRKRLAAGRQPVEAALDLHGMRQGEAHARLQAFLGGAQRDGLRVVLVVTGKGRGGGEAGVLRRLVPLWLTDARIAPLVVGFGEAARAHGGEGALYIHLRARRRHEPV